MNGIFNTSTHFVSFLASDIFFFFSSKCLYPLSRLREAASNVWGSIQRERWNGRQSWMWPNHRSSLGKWLKKKKRSIPCSLLFWYYCCFLINVEYWGGVIQLVGVVVRWVLVNQGFTVKDLTSAWWDYVLKKVVCEFITLRGLCISVSKPILYCRLAN